MQAVQECQPARTLPGRAGTKQTANPAIGIVMKAALLLFLGVLAAAAQIAPNPDGSITATASTISCSISNPGIGLVIVTCARNGIQYATINWQLDPGADRSGYEVVDGNAVNFSSSNVNGVLSWFLAAQPNGGAVIRASGQFPPFVGTLVLGQCVAFGSGITISGSAVILNEQAANCSDPV
jgi:hypothetical protein